MQCCGLIDFMLLLIHPGCHFKLCRSMSHWQLQEEEAVKGLTDRMKAVLSPFVLRRLKSQVASQLTAKQQHEEVVTMTPDQAALYQTAVQKLRADVGVDAKGVLLPLPACHQVIACRHAYVHTLCHTLGTTSATKFVTVCLLFHGYCMSYTSYVSSLIH